MEQYKTPGAIMAAAIWLSVVQVFCALWIRDGIKDAEPAEAPNYSQRLEAIEGQLFDIAKNTHDIDQELESPEEKHRHMQQLIDQMKAAKP